MTINKFASRITRQEGLKVSVSVAQVKEILKIINAHLGGALYKHIKSLT